MIDHQRTTRPFRGKTASVLRRVDLRNFKGSMEMKNFALFRLLNEKATQLAPLDLEWTSCKRGILLQWYKQSVTQSDSNVGPNCTSPGNQRELAPPGNWARRELGPQGIGPAGNWARRELGPQGTKPTGNWARRELGPPGTGPTGNWAHRELGPQGTGLAGNWASRELG